MFLSPRGAFFKRRHCFLCKEIKAPTEIFPSHPQYMLTFCDRYGRKEEKEARDLEEKSILGLYFAREEQAIRETDRKFGNLCRRIAWNILGCREDVEECVNDTWLAVWTRIPPERPDCLGAYLGRIVRNLAVSRYRKKHTQKRYMPIEVLLSELEECIPDSKRLEDEIDGRLLTAYIRDWLDTLPKEDRVLFVRRYWYGDSVQTLAAEFFRSGAQMAQKMLSLRRKLKIYLEAKGVEVP